MEEQLQYLFEGPYMSYMYCLATVLSLSYLGSCSQIALNITNILTCSSPLQNMPTFTVNMCVAKIKMKQLSMRLRPSSINAYSNKIKKEPNQKFQNIKKIIS